VKAKFPTSFFLTRLSLLIGCGILIPHGFLMAQWHFLGPQWVSADSVSSQAIAFNHHRQAHVAMVSNGAASVVRYDGAAWIPVGNGLPATDQVNCAMTMDADGSPLLALGPQLAVFAYSSGNWFPLPGLPVVADARDIQLRVAHDNRKWIAWWKPGSEDSTFIRSTTNGSNWELKGAFEGRIKDLELDDDGDPVLLIDDATALQHYDGGNWQPFPAFTHPSEDYIGLAMALDGTGTGAMVLRRDAWGDLSVESFSNGGWAQLGNSGFAMGDEADLGLSPSGILHLLTVQNASNGLPQVFQYLGGSWQLLGGQYVYNNTVSHPLLGFDPGATFVLFRDHEQDQRNSVMYFGSPVGAGGEMEEPWGELFPNPASEMVHLRWEHPQAGGVLRLCDAFGRNLGEWATTAALQQDLDVGHLPSGQYWLILQRPNRPAQFCSFTKIH
jgi:hypothetical protein